MPIDNDNKIEVWDSPKFVANYVAQNLFSNYEAVLPGHLEDIDEYNAFVIVSNNPPTFEEQEEELGMLKNVYGNAGVGVDITIQSKNIINDNGVDAVSQVLDELVKQCNKQASSRSDERIKRYYSDLAFVADPSKGNYTQMMFSSPYMSNFWSQTMAALVSPLGVSSSELKAGLGVPLYEATFDFMHATADEARTEYQRQQLERNGWTPESERRYLAELHKTHEATLRDYEKFLKFADDSQNNTNHYMGNDLATVLGLKPDSNRHVNPAMGIIRGENKAIENGWGKDELFILGMVGCVEEEIKRQETRKGYANVKASLPDFKSSFEKLKQECFYTNVNSAAQKLQIANKVLAFYLKQDTLAEKTVFGTPNNLRRKFVETYNSVAKAAAAETGLDIELLSFQMGDKYGRILKADGLPIRDVSEFNQIEVHEAEPDKLDHPEDYLRNLVGDGLRDGDLGRFMKEYIDITAKTAGLGDDAIAKVELASFTALFYRTQPSERVEIQKELTRSLLQLSIASKQAEDQLAEDIRAGRYEIDEKYQAFKNDFTFSKKYAKHLLADSPINKKLNAAQDLYYQFSANIPGHDNDMQTYKDEFIKNSSECLTEFEAKHYLKGVFDFVDAKRNAELNPDNVQPQNKEFKFENKDIATSIRGEKRSLGDFKDDFNASKRAASNHLEQIKTLGNHKPTAVWGGRAYHSASDPNVAVNPKKANSQAFANMVNAMEAVDRLTLDSTPKEMYEAYRNLRDASQAYAKKIDNQFMAGKSENGSRRRRYADTLTDFAEENLRRIGNLPENIAANVSVNKQTEKLAEVKTEVRNNLKATIEQDLNTEKDNCMERYFNYEEGEGTFKGNKNNLTTGICQLLVINTMHTDLNSQNGSLISPSDVSHEIIVRKAKNLALESQALKDMVKAIKTEEDCKKLMEKYKDNPNSILDDLSKYQKPEKAAAKDVPNDNVIQNQAPKVLK